MRGSIDRAAFANVAYQGILLRLLPRDFYQKADHPRLAGESA